MPAIDDAELVRRANEGDLEAFGSLMRRYKRLVFGVALSFLGSTEDANDVCQDVFIRAFTRLSQLRDGRSVGVWLRRIAVNECRAAGGRLRSWARLDELGLGEDPTPGLHRRIELARALEAIDEPSRVTVVLFYLHDYSMKDIGEFLDEPVTTIKSRLRNARAKLRKEMEEILERNLSGEVPPADFHERVQKLLAAVQAGDEGLTRTLLAADPRLVAAEESPSRMTPLHIAAASGATAVVELLLAHGADPNALDAGDNASPLHHAAERGRLEIVRLLVEAGSDPNWTLTVHEQGPLGWALMFDPPQFEVAAYLMEHGAKPDIFAAVALGRADLVRELVAAKPLVVRKRMSACEMFRSAIEFAAERRQVSIARLLVELGADVSLSDAAALGDAEQVRRRLEEGAGLADYALKCAVRAGQTETARILLQAGADANYAPQGTSLLFDSIGRNERAVSELLMEFGADIEFKDAQWNSSPLGWQVFFGRAETARLAIELGACVAEGLVELARAGMRGELRRWSPAAPEDYGEVSRVLRAQT